MAYLSAVGKTAGNNAFHGYVHRGRLVDDGWTLSAQLQGHWGQVLGGSAHHDTADGAAAGVEQVIKAALQQGSGFIHGAVDALNSGSIEVSER